MPQHRDASRAGRVRTAAWDPRWAEFVLLFILVPVGIALFLPPSSILPVLAVTFLASLFLLRRTDGFSWAELQHGWLAIDWRLVTGFAGFTCVASGAVVLLLAPEAFLTNPYGMPWLLPMVLLVYPLASVLPQEVFFRPLFFRRYGPLMRSDRVAVVANAAVFALAHLMFWNWVAAAMTFAGGLVFGWAYRVRRSFPLAVALHAVGGGILYVLGLGVFFYGGSVERPF